MHLDEGVPLAFKLDKLLGPNCPLAVRTLETLFLARDVLSDVAHHHLGAAAQVEDQTPNASLYLSRVVVAGMLAGPRAVTALMAAHVAEGYVLLILVLVADRVCRHAPAASKPNKATDYLSKVHIGQTERGSYVVNILSRVAPDLESETLFPTEPYEKTDPFERQVTRTLADALEATRTAAEYAAATGTIEYFRRAVESGVSANLCEAIVGMNESGGGEGLDIGLRWAPARPIRDSTSRGVSFPADTMPFIQEAARIFRKTPTQEGFEVEGYVIRLHRRELTGEGTITINSFVEDSPRLINVKLNTEDYDRAIEAHKFGIRVVCYGNLVKQGGQFVLLNPREFTLGDDQ